MIVGIVSPDADRDVYERLRNDIGGSHLVVEILQDGRQPGEFAADLWAMTFCDIILVPGVAMTPDWDAWAHMLVVIVGPRLNDRLRVVLPSCLRKEWLDEVSILQLWALELLPDYLAADSAVR